MSTPQQRAASGAARPAPAIDGAPPVAPNLVREVPGEKQVGRNTLETLLFRGLSTPIALVLVVVQSRFLAPSGRGTFVLAVLTVTILSRLLGQLGLAVTTRMRERELEVRHLVHRAFGRRRGRGALPDPAARLAPLRPARAPCGRRLTGYDQRQWTGSPHLSRRATAR